jgi:hypothetical protein
MRILLDEGVPVGIAGHLPGHDVRTVSEMGWAGTTNGALIAAAEATGFDAMVTGDQNLVHQQNLSGRTLAVVVLSTNHWPTLQAHPNRIATAVGAIAAGGCTRVRFPRPPLRRRSRAAASQDS